MKLVNRVNRCTGAVNGHMIVIFLLLRILLVQDYCIVPMHAGADATVQYSIWVCLVSCKQNQTNTVSKRIFMKLTQK